MSKSNDNERVYDEQVNPLVLQVYDICKAHDLPFLMVFEHAPHGYFCTTAWVPPHASANLHTLADDIADALRRKTIGRGGTPAPRITDIN
jgi:hypothetical protein